VVDWSEIFPQIELITDSELREKVKEVWHEALKLGGWKEQDMKEIPFTLLVSETSLSLIEHTKLVTDISIRIKDTLLEYGFNINSDYLIAGAILHDVGKLLEYRKDKEGISVSKSGKHLRHPLSGLALAAKALLPEEVCHIIAVHSREGDGSYRSPEAIVVHHADFVSFEVVKSALK